MSMVFSENRFPLFRTLLETKEAVGSGPRIRTARVVVNSHASPPRGVHRNNWWSNGVTLPARRSCKDRLHLVLAPWCPDVVSSHALLRFRQALSPDQLSERTKHDSEKWAPVFGKDHASKLMVRTPVIETGPSEWRSDARPSSYIRLVIGRRGVTRTPGLTVRNRALISC